MIPARGEVFLDARDGGRAARLTWHHEAGVVVLSLWRGGACTGTFQLPVELVPDFVEVLVRGLADRPGAAGAPGEASLPATG